MKRWAGLAALMLWSASAHAAPETHDGFYLRLDLGFGYDDMKADSKPEISVTGSGGGFGLSIGGMVVENFGVFAEVSDALAISPKLKVGDVEADTKDDVSVGVVGYGAGIIYYFEPVNVYVSVAALADKLQIEEDNDKVAETDSGLGIDLMVGKEWWVSDEWGLGIAGAFRHSSMKDQHDGPTWTANSFNVAFSATFN